MSATITAPAENGETCEAFRYHTPSAAPVCGAPAEVVTTYSDAFGEQHTIAQCAAHRTDEAANRARAARRIEQEKRNAAAGRESLFAQPNRYEF